MEELQSGARDKSNIQIICGTKNLYDLGGSGSVWSGVPVVAEIQTKIYIQLSRPSDFIIN